MKLSRNSPCPCGSGKKYKRCCGSQSDILDGLSLNDFQSIDQLNDYMEVLVDQKNSQPLKEFLGLSPRQMRLIFSDPWNVPDLVIYKKGWYPKRSIAFDMVVRLLNAIGPDGVKSTQKGKLPLKIVMPIWEEMPKDEFQAMVRIRSEDHFRELSTVRICMELAGLIKLQKGRFSLTEKGQDLTYLNQRGELFLEVIMAYTRKYNWGYHDGYEDIHIIQDSFLYTLYMLSIFGKDWRPTKFIEDRFLEAFPTALNEVEGNAYFSQEEILRQCYRHRLLDCFAHFWGLIKMREIKIKDSFVVNYEFKVSELSDWLTFHA